MTDVTIGLLHPGEMGAAVGQCLAAAGHQVLWTDQGRSPATRERAEAAGLKAAGIEDIAARSDVVFSVCPPHAALDVAREVAGAGFGGLYVDANAVSPERAREDALLAEWAISQPGRKQQTERAAGSAAAKGWRWVAEMEEIVELIEVDDRVTGPRHPLERDLTWASARDAAARHSVGDRFGGITASCRS